MGAKISPPPPSPEAGGWHGDPAAAGSVALNGFRADILGDTRGVRVSPEDNQETLMKCIAFKYFQCRHKKTFNGNPEHARFGCYSWMLFFWCSDINESFY